MYFKVIVTHIYVQYLIVCVSECVYKYTLYIYDMIVQVGLACLIKEYIIHSNEILRKSKKIKFEFMYKKKRIQKNNTKKEKATKLMKIRNKLGHNQVNDFHFFYCG